MNDAPEQMTETAPVARAYAVDDISSAGITGHIEASEKQLEEMASMLDLVELASFRFEFQLHRTKRSCFKLKGQLHAGAIQSCVVSLDPIRVVIEEDIDIDLWPAEDVAQLETDAEPESMSLQLEGPEPISGDNIDVGQLAYEHFAAALDLYPKKIDARFDWRDQASGEKSEKGSNPFAALAELKRLPDTD